MQGDLLRKASVKAFRLGRKPLAAARTRGPALCGGPAQQAEGARLWEPAAATEPVAGRCVGTVAGCTFENSSMISQCSPGGTAPSAPRQWTVLRQYTPNKQLTPAELTRRNSPVCAQPLPSVPLNRLLLTSTMRRLGNWPAAGSGSGPLQGKMVEGKISAQR